MKDNYKTSVSLSCITCGGEKFDFNEDKSWIKCITCNREYTGGYDELVTMNQESISLEVEAMKQEVAQDLKDELTAKFKAAFKENKNFKLK